MSGNEDVESAGSDNEVGESERQLKPIPEYSGLEKVLMVVAVIAAGAAIGAILLRKRGMFILPAAILGGFVVGPVLIMLARQLTDILAMKQTFEATKREVEIFKRENGRLEKSVDELDGTVSRLEDMETALDVITQTRGQNVEEFEKQIETNKQILTDMKKSMHANIRQNLLQVIYSSDIDGDQTIGLDEIDDLIERIDLSNGVDLNEEKFRDALTKSGGNLASILDLVKDMVAQESDSNEIFMLK